MNGFSTNYVRRPGSRKIWPKCQTTLDRGLHPSNYFHSIHRNGTSSLFMIRSGSHEISLYTTVATTRGPTITILGLHARLRMCTNAFPKGCRLRFAYTAESSIRNREVQGQDSAVQTTRSEVLHLNNDCHPVTIICPLGIMATETTRIDK